MDDIRIGDLYESIIDGERHFVLCTKVGLNSSTGEVWARGISTYPEAGKKIRVDISDKVYINVYDPENDVLCIIGTMVEKVPIAHIEPSKILESLLAAAD